MALQLIHLSVYDVSPYQMENQSQSQAPICSQKGRDLILALTIIPLLHFRSLKGWPGVIWNQKIVGVFHLESRFVSSFLIPFSEGLLNFDFIFFLQYQKRNCRFNKKCPRRLKRFNETAGVT